MDFQDGNIDIIPRISYMLASALRREDADNFLNIYDTIIPQGFTNKQVDNIKQKARELSERSEEEFCKTGLELGLCDSDVIMSRSQQAFMNSISRTSQGSSTVDSNVSKDASPVTLSSNNSSSASSMEDGDSRNGAFWDYCSPSLSHSSAKDKVTVHNPEKVPVRKDKVVVHHPIDDDLLEQVFDYYPDKDDLCEVVVDHFDPPRKPTHYEDKNNQTRRQNDMGYDEVYMAEEEDPRKVVTLMDFAQYNENTQKLNDQKFDESHTPADNMPKAPMNLHQKLYGMRSQFSPAMRESKDDASPSSSPRRGPVYCGVGRGVRRLPSDVDQSVNFFSLPRASEGTEISSDCYTKTDRLLGSCEFASRSYGSLEEGCGRRIAEEDSVINNNIDSKKKKKKKKSGKDDSGGKLESKTTNKEPMDVNGNPVIGKSNTTSDNKPHQNQQQRLNKTNGPPLSDYSDEKAEDVNRDGSMPPSSDNAPGRRKKKKESPLRKAEDLFPNNCGDKSVDDLLNFIENSKDNASKRKKEKSKAIPNSVSPSSVSDKTVGKKVKKGRSSSLSDSPKESEVGSENGEDVSSRVSESSEMKDVSSEPTQSEVSSVDLNHKMPTSPTPAALPTDDVPQADMDFHNYNDNYIFTDKDIAAIADKDNEFQVVCKKKKPKPTVTSSSSFHREHYDHHFNHFARDYHRHVPVARSVTPPPKSSGRPDKRDRAFSPSGFPELGGNARGCEGRRNSTGNVQVEVSPDDSDLESVKSLPAGTCNDLLSTCPVISYAKIAAKPRQNNGISLVAPALSNKAAGEDITNAEDVQQPHADVCSPASLSPELPTLIDLPASNNCDLQASCKSISKAKTPTVSSQDTDLPARNEVVASSRDTTPICNSGDIFAKDNVNKFDLEFVGESHIQSNDDGSSQNNSTACRGSGGDNTLTCFASKLRPAVSSSVDIKASSNNAQCSTQNVSKPVENNHKKSTACSVIFMDRPAHGLVSASPKIDVSFGFDEPCGGPFYEKVKVVHHKANGLILPAPPQGSPGLTFLGPETDLVSDHIPEGKLVPLAAGEPSSLAPLQSSEPAASRVGLPACMAGLRPVIVPEHLYDPRNDCANFALEDSVYFIRREWNRLQDLAQKSQEKVIIYCCD